MPKKATAVPRAERKGASKEAPVRRIIGPLRISVSCRSKGWLYLVSVMDDGDGSIISLHARAAKKLMDEYLAEQKAKYPKLQVTIGAYNEEQDGISYLLQRY